MDADGQDHRFPRGAVVGLGVWAAAIVAAVVWPRLRPLPDRSGVDAPPFYGRWEWHDVARVAPAAIAAVLLVWAWPVLVDRLSTARLALASGAASVGWALLLAGSGGLEVIWRPFGSKHAYLGAGSDLDAGEFVRTYIERLDGYPVHLKGHPPGMPLLLRALDTIGLGGAGGAAIATFVVWGLGIAAVLVTVAELSDADVARRASGAVAFLPAVVFAASTYDALFAGAMAITTALLVLAARRSGRWWDVAALGGGALGAACLHLSYGLAPLGLLALIVMVRARRVRPVALAGVGFVAVVAAFVAAGFWWFDGLDATKGYYAEGISQFRPYGYFVFAGNPGALALSVGPVAAAGLGALVARPRSLWPAGWGLVAVAALVAVVAADLTGLSNAEVERIWLPFMPWLAVGAAALPVAGRRWWLASSLAIGVVLQVALVTPW